MPAVKKFTLSPQVIKEMVAVSESQSVPNMELVDPWKVSLWEKNPRHNDKAVQKLALLLTVYGQKTPIVCWKQNNFTYKGNTTLKAIRYLTGLTQEQFLEFTKDVRERARVNNLKLTLLKPTKVLVLWQDFKDVKEAEAYAVSDNKASEWTGWDEDLLDEMIHDGGDIKLLAITTGFTEDEIKNLQLIPDLDKLQNLKQGADTITGLVKLVCPSQLRDELVEWLKEELPLAKFTEVEIR